MGDQVRGSMDRVNTKSFDLNDYTLIGVSSLINALKPESLCSLEILMKGKV
jgi:hypothetical protein